jgi:hypothetical protein
MSQTKAQLLAPIGIITCPGLDVTVGGSSPFQVGSTGIITAVSASFSGDVAVGGTLTYEDVTNIDSVGLITARKGINVTAGVSTFAANIDANANINANGNIIGDNSTNISGIASVTATTYYGSGANLTGIDGGGKAQGVAGLNITNGATVAVASSDGKFYPVTGVTEAYGTPAEALDSATPIAVPQIAYDTVNNKVIAAMQGHSDDDGRVAVGTVSGTTISWGTTVKYNGTTNARPTGVCYDSANEKVVVVFREDTGQLWSIVGTVSGTSISFGTKVNVDSNTGNILPNCAYDSTTGKVIITYRRTTTDLGSARVGTVSGTSISWGAEVNWTSSAITQSEVACHDGYGIFVSDNKICVGQISGTSITFGTLQTIPFSDGNVNTDETNIALDPNTGTIMVGGMRDQTDKFVEVFAATRSGTTLTFGSGVVLKQNATKNTTCCWSGSENTFFWSFDSGTSGADGLQSTIVTVTGTTAVAKTPRVWYAPANNDIVTGQSCVFDPDSQAVVVFYQNGAVTNNAWYYVERNRISNGTRGGFVGLSDAAYTAGQTATISVSGSVNASQTGLSTAAAYYLLADGSLSTAPDSENLFVGNAISGTSIIVR